MGVCGVHDVKTLRNAAETVCDDIYEGISDRERTEIVSETINHCISSSFQEVKVGLTVSFDIKMDHWTV